MTPWTTGAKLGGPRPPMPGARNCRSAVEQPISMIARPSRTTVAGIVGRGRRKAEASIGRPSWRVGPRRFERRAVPRVADGTLGDLTNEVAVERSSSRGPRRSAPSSQRGSRLAAGYVISIILTASARQTDPLDRSDLVRRRCAGRRRTDQLLELAR